MGWIASFILSYSTFWAPVTNIPLDTTGFICKTSQGNIHVSNSRTIQLGSFECDPAPTPTAIPIPIAIIPTATIASGIPTSAVPSPTLPGGTVIPAGPDPSFACLGDPGETEIVSGFFNTSKFEPAIAANKKFNARNASFEYPETFSHSMVVLRGNAADNMCWAGGYFTSSKSWHDLNVSWDTSKKGPDDVGSNRGEMNNTTSVDSWTNNMTWTGLHVYNMHDGMRTSDSDNNWTIQHTWLDYIRDDCIENDHIYSGKVYDVLFDGCYVGISVRSGSGYPAAGQTVTMDKVLLRMEPMPYPYKWDTKSDPTLSVPGYAEPFGYGNTFKIDDANVPNFRVTNSVFLHEYDSQQMLFPPKVAVTECSNNTIIWLDGPATAPNYLLTDFPGCFTIITDRAQGLALWKNIVTDWHARHPGVGADKKSANPGVYTWPRY